MDNVTRVQDPHISDRELVIHTRFPWHQFNEQWQKGILAYAASEFRDPRVTAVHIDHINTKNETFQPWTELSRL